VDAAHIRKMTPTSVKRTKIRGEEVALRERGFRVGVGLGYNDAKGLSSGGGSRLLMTGFEPSSDTGSDVEESVLSAPGLTFADGLQFGCGFMVAVTLSMIILALAVLAVVLLLSLAGISVL